MVTPRGCADHRRGGRVGEEREAGEEERVEQEEPFQNAQCDTGSGPLSDPHGEAWPWPLPLPPGLRSEAGPAERHGRERVAGTGTGSARPGSRDEWA